MYYRRQALHTVVPLQYVYVLRHNPTTTVSLAHSPLFYDERRTMRHTTAIRPLLHAGPKWDRDADWSFGSIRQIDANAIEQRVQRHRDLISIDYSKRSDDRCSDFEYFVRHFLVKFHRNACMWDFRSAEVSRFR